jgi:hypothetical protein
MIAHVDDLAAGLVGDALQHQAFAGRAHAGLVQHDHPTRRQPATAVFKIGQQSVQRGGLDARAVAERLSRGRGRRHPHHLDPGPFVGFAGHGQRVGLARAGLAHDHAHAVPGGADPDHHRPLILIQLRMGGQHPIKNILGDDGDLIV